MALTKTADTNDKPYPKDIKLLETKIIELQTAVESLVTLTTEMRTDYNAHVHGGITAGSANSAVADQQTSAAAVTL